MLWDIGSSINNDEWRGGIRLGFEQIWQCQWCWEIKREVIPNLVQKINSALLCVV